ncbi:ArnT family glycosyltransferase [Leptospira sp. GIMC2001]|uniref:ArnT family glycosyltransferase n=1 Tax=Leptospira sp. GIMC2001 TaxID=1513297 RepID=UPI00234B740E|nr:hypothetical protein [Leptospira sp. GIMC2001]WCL49581.1 hypothetical protein O4O04_01830 [Leptospira sp. GIMC2001]
MRLWLLAFVSFSFLLFSYYLGIAVPFIWPDEVLFFNPAQDWYLNKTMRTSVLSGLIPGMDTHTLWNSPLYMLLLGSSFHIWEDNLFNSRMFSSLIGFLSVFVTYIFMQKQLSNTTSNFDKKYISFSKNIPILVAIVILTDILFIKVSHTSRMETLCILMGIIALYLCYNNKYFISGLFLGLSFVSHPFGAFYGIPVAYLIFRMNFQSKISILKILILVAVGGIIPLICWSFYLVPNWDDFLIQYGAQLSRKKDLFQTFTQLDKVKIFFSGYYFPIPKLISFIAIICYAIYIERKGRNRELIQFHFVWLISMVIGFYFSTESWYVVHAAFPLACLFALSVSEKVYPLLIIGGQILLLIWFTWSFSIKENAFASNDIFMKKVEEIASDSDNIYLQLIPDPYFHLKEKYPEKKLFEFIPGELPIAGDFMKPTINKMDLFLFYDDSLANSTIRSIIQDSTQFEKTYIEIPYSSYVPAKGPWKIFAYKRIRK